MGKEMKNTPNVSYQRLPRKMKPIRNTLGITKFTPPSVRVQTHCV